jgi:SRSO17 transposase
MTESEIAKCRKRLEQFLADLMEPLGRRELRHWGSVYVRGLLSDGERKSIEPMAARLPEGNVQAMQQLIGQSPWPWAPVWRCLAQRMTAELTPDPVWVIDDTGFPKQGHQSVRVARQYSGTLGKTANCQVAVSLHQAGGEESTILGWRLYLPKGWTQNVQRRAEAGIPAGVKFQTKWQLALELIDAAQAWGLRCGVALADAGYGEVREFRQGLEARQLLYAVGIPSTLGV